MSDIHMTAVGVARPSRRLDRADMAAAWGRKDSGLLAVCGPDEDAITLVVAAASRLGVSPTNDTAAVCPVDTVVFASSSPVRPGGSAAATACLALGLRTDVRTIDLTGSNRCGTQAWALAVDLVRADADRRVLVLLGDDRAVPHDDPLERTTGHAGVAAVISTTPGAARVDGYNSVWDAAPDRWVSAAGSIQSAGERFLSQTVYPDLLRRAADQDEQISKAVPAATGIHVAGGSPKLAAQLASVLSVGTSCARKDLWALGDTGAAMSGLLLADALYHARPDETHLLVATGAGVDVLTVTAGDADAVHLDPPGPTPTIPYGIRLRHSGQTVTPPTAPAASPVVAWRDQEATTGLMGMACQTCGTRSYPHRPVCPSCHGADALQPTRMVGAGIVVTATTDHLVAGVNPGTPESPTTMVVAELDDGGRIFLPAVHDANLQVGQPVETVFRVAHDGGGFRNYHWRVRPLTDPPIEKDES